LTRWTKLPPTRVLLAREQKARHFHFGAKNQNVHDERAITSLHANDTRHQRQIMVWTTAAAAVAAAAAAATAQCKPHKLIEKV